MVGFGLEAGWGAGGGRTFSGTGGGGCGHWGGGDLFRYSGKGDPGGSEIVWCKSSISLSLGCKK